MEPLGMFSQTYLYKRLGFKNYYLRMRIPLDLQYLYDDRQEIKRSLKTADPREAKRRMQVMALKQQQEFEELRRKLAGSAKLVLDGGDASIEAICSRWQHEVLGWDEASRVDRPPRIDLAESRENRVAVEPLLREVLVTGKWKGSNTFTTFFFTY